MRVYGRKTTPAASAEPLIHVETGAPFSAETEAIVRAVFSFKSTFLAAAVLFGSVFSVVGLVYPDLLLFNFESKESPVSSDQILIARRAVGMCMLAVVCLTLAMVNPAHATKLRRIWMSYMALTLLCLGVGALFTMDVIRAIHVIPTSGAWQLEHLAAKAMLLFLLAGAVLFSVGVFVTTNGPSSDSLR